MSVSTTLKIEMKNDGGRRSLDRNLASLNNNHVKVGFPDSGKVGGTSRKGSGHKPYSDMSEVSRIAIWNEFGVPAKGGGFGIPPRPFFRNALDNSKKALSEHQEKLIKLVMSGKMAADAAFDALGIFMQDKIKASIRAFTDPPNAQSTIDRKGSSHPLIDTGQMINSVTYAKVEGKPEAEGTFQ